MSLVSGLNSWPLRDHADMMRALGACPFIISSGTIDVTSWLTAHSPCGIPEQWNPQHDEVLRLLHFHVWLGEVGNVDGP
jgi:hypothetical protein